MPKGTVVKSTPLYDIIVHGAGERDEVFTSANYGGGGFNVSKFKRLLEGKPHKFELVKIPLKHEFVAYVTGFIAVDREHINNMSVERRDEPIFVVVLPDANPPHFIIDGHHRLLRRHQDGFSDIEAWVMPSRMLPTILVTRTKVRK